MYYQIEEDIKIKIDNNEYATGDVIPSERDLSETYDVSRMTVRQAVNNLVNEGFLFRQKGRGTFVSEKKIEQGLQGMTSFTEDMKQRGMTASNKLLSFEKVKAPQSIAEKLELSEAASVVMVQRIRFADEQPMAVETTYIPLTLFPHMQAEDIQGSFYQYVEKVQPYKIGKAKQIIEASTANEQEMEYLQVSEHSAVLLIERQSRLENGTPFEVVKSAYRADRYKFISDIHRT
nr:GntR family transcriptional regulator [Thalassobacillus sp. CUG 92003]